MPTAYSMLASCSLSATINRCLGFFISNAEQPITGIAQPGENIPFLVECPVNRGSKDRQLRIVSAHPADAFRRGDQVHHPHMLGTQLRQQVHRSHGTPPGGEHRSEEHTAE